MPLFFPFSLAWSGAEHYDIVDKAVVLQDFKEVSLQNSKSVKLCSVHTMKSVYF